MDKNQLHRQALEDTAKRAGERSRESNGAVDNRSSAKAWIHLNQFDVEPLGFEEAFTLAMYCGMAELLRLA